MEAKISAVFLLAIFGLGLALVDLCSGQTDTTLVPRTSGRDVSEAVVRKIKRSAIFTEDSDFTRRLAWVETKFGNDPKTYRDGYFGGIWQVDERIYNPTKDVVQYPRLSAFHTAIKSAFGIDWLTTTWESLQIPLYSALAMRLHFAGVRIIAIPGTLNAQAQIWLLSYTSNDTVTARDFIDQVRELEDEVICKGKMDICIVLDGSGSVQLPNFNRALGFVADLVDTFEVGPEAVRSGFVEYSDDVVTIFPVENDHSKPTLIDMIKKTRYSGGATNTPGGILRAVSLLTGASSRSGVPRVQTILTDGLSNRGNLTTAIAEARRNEIYSFAVGIGPAIQHQQLLEIAYGDPTHVFALDSFEALAEFFYRLNAETCTTPQRPEWGDTVTDTLTAGEKRYYLYTIPQEGMTVKLSLETGATVVYFSYEEDVPSSAINDGWTDEEYLFIPNPGTPASRNTSKNQFQASVEDATVYLAIQGILPDNQYKLEVLTGDQVPVEETTSPPVEETTPPPVEKTTPPPVEETTASSSPKFALMNASLMTTLILTSSYIFTRNLH